MEELEKERKVGVNVQSRFQRSLLFTPLGQPN